MTRISSQPSRKLFPIAALALGALVFAAAPVSVGSSGVDFQQAYAKGNGGGGSEGGSGDRGADKGGAEGSSADRGADSGSADKGSADAGVTGAAGISGGSADVASHDARDR